MPLLVNFTNPLIILCALIIFVGIWYLSGMRKSNTAPCIELLVYLFVLIIYTVELITFNNDSETIINLTKCVTVDEIFVLISFLNLLWADKLQLEKEKKIKGKDKKTKVEKSYEDGLDIMFKKI